MPKLKVDLHVHTDFSDSASGLREVVAAALEKGLDGIAITDHGTCQAARIAVREYSKAIIAVPGLEYAAKEGHLLGLGLLEPPPKGLTALEFSGYVRACGGVLVVPHPKVPFLGARSSVYEARIADAIETRNAAAPFFWWVTKRSEALAERLKLPQTGGSDAHEGVRVGDAYTVVDSDSRDPSGVLRAIKEGRAKPEGKASPLLYRLGLSLSFLKGGKKEA